MRLSLAVSAVLPFALLMWHHAIGFSPSCSQRHRRLHRGRDPLWFGVVGQDINKYIPSGESLPAMDLKTPLGIDASDKCGGFTDPSNPIFWCSGICTVDSDGDAFSNAEELGDVACKWTSGSAVDFLSTNIGDPNEASSTPHVNGDVPNGKLVPSLHGAWATAHRLQGWAAFSGVDSDGDGYTNGEELGDPKGGWKVGDAEPAWGGAVTDPNDATSYPTKTATPTVTNTASSTSTPTVTSPPPSPSTSSLPLHSSTAATSVITASISEPHLSSDGTVTPNPNTTMDNASTLAVFLPPRTTTSTQPTGAQVLPPPPVSSVPQVHLSLRSAGNGKYLTVRLPCHNRTSDLLAFPSVDILVALNASSSEATLVAQGIPVPSIVHCDVVQLTILVPLGLSLKSRVGVQLAWTVGPQNQQDVVTLDGDVAEDAQPPSESASPPFDERIPVGIDDVTEASADVSTLTTQRYVPTSQVFPASLGSFAPISFLGGASAVEGQTLLSKSLRASCSAGPFACAFSSVLSTVKARFAIDDAVMSASAIMANTVAAMGALHNRDGQSGDYSQWLRRLLRLPNSTSWPITVTTTFVQPYGKHTAKEMCETILSRVRQGCSVMVASWTGMAFVQRVVLTDAVCVLHLALWNDNEIAQVATTSVLRWDVERNKISGGVPGVLDTIVFAVPVCMAAPGCGWKQFTFAYAANGTVMEQPFKAWGCAGQAMGDPHYRTLSGRLATCDKPGWNTLVASSEAVIDVFHAPVGSTTATAVISARITFAQKNRTITFGPVAEEGLLSDAEVLVNANAATDTDGRNYVEVQRVKTGLGTFLNVLAVMSAPRSGILVEGCPDEPALPSVVTESAACADIHDPLARRACNIDVARTGSTDFVNMAAASVTLQESAPSVAVPSANESLVKAPARPKSGSLATVMLSPGIVAVVAVSSVAMIGIGGVVCFLLRRDYLRRKKNRRDKPTVAPKIIYVDHDSRRSSMVAEQGDATLDNPTSPPHRGCGDAASKS